MASEFKMKVLTVSSNVVDFIQQQVKMPKSKTFQRTSIGGFIILVLVLVVPEPKKPLRPLTIIFSAYFSHFFKAL